MGLRESILSASDRPMQAVEVPEWGQTLYVRTLSGKERDAFEENSLVRRGKSREVTLANVRARLVTLCACDASGTPVFQPGDADALGEKSARALDRLYAAASRLNGISEEDVQELVKNSGTIQSDASGSSSATVTAAQSPSSNNLSPPATLPS